MHHKVLISKTQILVPPLTSLTHFEIIRRKSRTYKNKSSEVLEQILAMNFGKKRTRNLNESKTSQK